MQEFSTTEGAAALLCAQIYVGSLEKEVAVYVTSEAGGSASGKQC